MGSEQSSPKSSRTSYTYSRQQLEDDDIDFERLQAEQRIIYEQIMNQQRLQARQNIRASTTPTGSNRRLSGTQSNQNFTGQSVTAKPVLRPVSNTTQSQPPASNSPIANLERQRTPYNYSSAQLSNTTDLRQNIYPNLGNGNPTIPQRSMSAQRASTSHHFEGRSNVSDFVFINSSNESNRLTPSAPPINNRVSSSDRRNRGRNINQNKNPNNCQTCNNKFSSKIYQCSNGHSSCSDCHMKKSSCGLCFMKITDMRNITLEDYMSQQVIPCPNADDGCCLSLKMLDMDNHVKECQFKEILCPVNLTKGFCNWQGKIRQLADHFNDIHPEQIQGKVNSELLLTNICVSSHTLYFIPLGPFNFLVHIKVCENERKVFMAVQLLGTDKSAANWNYEIHIFNKREPRRKYQFSDICTSANTPIQNVFNEADCAVLPQAYAMTFINEGTLSYKFYIKQNQEERKEFKGNYRGRGGCRRKY